MPRIRPPQMGAFANGVAFQKTGISPWRCGRKNAWDKCESRPIFTASSMQLKSQSLTTRHEYRDRSRTSVQAGVISQPRPGQHRGLRPFLPLCPDASGRISFVKKACRCDSDGRLHPFCSRSPMQRHDVESVDSEGASPAASTNLIRPASIKVMQRTFNPLNGERYPGGPPIHCRVV